MGFPPFAARYIKFDIDSNHGGDNNFYGLSEVQFDGSLFGVELSASTFLTSASQGTAVGTLSTPSGDAADTFTYTLVGGDGSTDNDKFQINGDELQIGTFDFTGAADGAEFSVRIRSTGTPSGAEVDAALILTAIADSDSDGILDTWEEMWTDPNDPNRLDVLSGLGGANADGDSLTDLEEFNLRDQFPALDPTKADTDEDTLEDGAEVAGAGARPPTDPTNPDTDGDTLTDAVESNTGTFVGVSDTGTDPTVADTDGDGTGDALEVAGNTDPTDPTSFPAVQLVGLWRFDGNADDSSGLGNHGTLMGTPGPAFDSDVPAPLAGGQSLSFTTGSDHDEHVLVPHSPTLDTDGEITITAWIKPENNMWDGIIAKTPSVGPQNFPGNYELRTNNGNGALEFGWERTAAPGFEFLGPSSGAVLANEWAHVAFTAEAGGDYTYYIDGVPSGTGPMPDTFGSIKNTNPLYIGNRADLTTIEFHGLMDDVALFNGVLGEAQILKIMDGDFSDVGIGSSSLQLDIDLVGGELVIKWPSALGLLYNLRSIVDPSSAEPKDWPIYDGNMDIEADPPTNTLTIPLPPEPTRFFVIEEFPAPPVSLVSDDFENGQGAWTAGSDGAAGTNWELGSPSSGPGAANSGVTCFGTNLSADYEINANTWLRSPAIDLTGVGAATLHYAQFTDIEVMFDSGTVNILSAADDSLLVELETDIDGSTATWELVSQALPPEALDKVIKIEFRFESDEFGNLAGWFIDDFSVTVP